MENQNIIDEENVPYMNEVLKGGLILAGVSVVTSLLTNMSSNMGVKIIIGLVSFVFFIYYIRKVTIDHTKSNLGGFISFKRAFMIALIMGVISIFASTIFEFIYANYINPSAIDDKVNQVVSMMESFGMPEEELDKAAEEARKGITDPSGILKNFAGGSIFWALISLIFGAVLKKKQPFFQA